MVTAGDGDEPLRFFARFLGKLTGYVQEASSVLENGLHNLIKELHASALRDFGCCGSDEHAR